MRRGSAPSRGADRELDAGSRAHYDDPSYYTSTYRRRIDDVQFYVTLAEKSGGPVLEYGVGNGRIALPVARHGVAVTGIDMSRAMLDDFRKRLLDEPPEIQKRITLRMGDMRSTRLGRRYPLVVCPFNAALHLYTRSDVERFLARVREHIAPNGRFVMDISVPVFEDLLRDPAKAYRAPRFRHPTTGDMVKYTEHFDYDRIRQVLFVSMEFEPMSTSQGAWMTPLTHRQFFPQEWEAHLHYNGFEVEKVEGDFHGGTLDRTSDVMVWHTRPRRGWRSR